MATGAQPRLVNLVEASAKKHIAIGIVFATFVGGTFWYNVVRARKQAYRQFYETYDAEAAYARMKTYGYFQSVPKGGFPSSEGERKGDKPASDSKEAASDKKE